MGQQTFYDNHDINFLEKTGDSYANAQAAAPTVGSIDTNNWVGQYFDGADYFIWRIYLAFDTSEIPDAATILSAVIKFFVSENLTVSAEFTLYGDDQAWEPTLGAGDWSASAEDEFSLNTATMGGTGQKECNVDTSVINKTGDTEFELRSSREGTEPTGYELIKLLPGYNEVVSQKPQLVIHWNEAPQAPTGLSPSSSVIDYNAENVFSWTFNDPDSEDTQSAYQIQVIRVSDGVTVVDTGKTVGVSSQHAFAAATFSQGVQYQWKVKTWDNHDVAGAWSSLAAFTAKEAPTVTVDTPADAGSYGASELTVEWTFDDDDGDDQGQYLAVLKDEFGNTLETSGWTASANAQHTFAYAVVDGIDYQVTVTVKDTDGLSSDADTNSFSVSYTPPPTPTFTLAPNNAGGYIGVNIANPGPDPGVPDADSNDVYRREAGTSTWTRIATGIAKNGSYSDYAVASGVTYEYKVSAVADTEGNADSDTDTDSITISGMWLHDVSDPSGTALNLPYQTGREDWEPEAALMKYAGRDRPVAEFGEMEDFRFTAKVQILRGSDAWASLRALARRKATLCARDSRGRKLFGVMLRLPEQDERYGYGATVEVVETSYGEEV